MAQTYSVSYKINVVGVEEAKTALNTFTAATKQLTEATQPFRKLNTSINDLKNRLNSLSQKAPVVQIKTGEAERRLDRLIGKLRQYKAEVRSLSTAAAIPVAGGASSTRTRGTTAGARTVTPPAPAPAPTPPAIVAPTVPKTTQTPKASTKAVRTARTAQNAIARNIPNNLGYKTLGPTPLDVGGIGAINLLKGMGIAYGIAGMGTLISNVIKDATAYDNSMQTVRNILATHDKREGFDSRFKGMERIVRDVGIETKFTAPEVADAAKFLAMAGFNVEGINQSIKPIADIALVGDTELGETADVVTNIMTGYGIDPSRVRNAADVMTMTFTKSNTTLMEMAEAYKYAASLLSMNGTSFEEATAALGILGDAGIKGSQAGTTMRTIALNIAKPTKKQAEAWKSIGVQRLDSNGNVRDLLTIFQDLHDKNLSISQLGSLFHKTATMGAGVLANHIEKWNEVIEQNFLSEGLAERLAEKKKNTIQGLWAQLTSAFTEDGIRAFEGVQVPVKDMLKSVTEWLKTPEAAEAIQTAAKDFMEFARMMKDATSWILTLVNKFKPFVAMWIKFQIFMWPLLTGLKTFKAAIFGLGGIVKATGWISKLAGAFGALTAAVRTAGGVGLWSMLKNTISGYYVGLKQNGATVMQSYIAGATSGATQTPMPAGAPVTPAPVAAPALAIATNQPQNQKQSWLQKHIRGAGWIGGAFAGTAGAALGGWLGSKIGDEGSPTSMWSSIVGSVLGGAGATWAFAGGLKAVAAGLMSITGVFGGLLATVGAAIYIWRQYRNGIEEAIEAHHKYLSSIATLNGISYSEHATEADKYYSIVYNRQLDTNQAISEHIKLIKEQLGLLDTTQETLENKVKFKDSHKEIADRLLKSFGGFTGITDWRSALQPETVNGQEVPYLTPILYRQQWEMGGAVSDIYRFNGMTYNADNKNSLSQLAAAKLLMAMGHDTSKGGEAKEIIDKNTMRILRSTSLRDYNAILADVWSLMNSRSWIKGSEYWSVGEILDNTEAENHKGYHYVTGLRKAVKEQFQINNPQTPLAKQLLTFSEILRAYQNHAKVSEEVLKKYLLESGIDIFNEQRYGVFGSEDWLKSLGYKDGEWNVWWNDTYTDANGQERTRRRKLTTAEAQAYFLKFHEHIISEVKRLSPLIQPYFDSFINNPIWNLGKSDNKGTGLSVEGEVFKDDDGQYFTYHDGKWYPSDEDGKIIASPRTPIPDAPFRRAHNMDAGNDGDPLNNLWAPRNYDYDYKSKYRNYSAAPKQVIVNIDNLMNVESVDLSNPENKAVIDDLKGQLTQALVDVVHDFDETWHG